MTEKYQAYLTMLYQRDQVLGTMAMLAVGLVIAYHILDAALPAPWNRHARQTALVGGLGLYVITLLYVALGVA